MSQTNKMNRIAPLIGVISLILAVYVYFTTRDVKEVSYHLDSNVIKIFDRDLIKDNQKLTLYKTDSIKVNDNVYLATFSIWNSGNQPIPPKDVRKEIQIQFEGVDEILDYKLLKNIDPEISKLKINQISNSSFNLNWTYFDPNDGIKAQMLFTGSPDIEAFLEGKILLTNFIIHDFDDKKNSVSYLYTIFFITFFQFFITYIAGKRKNGWFKEVEEDASETEKINHYKFLFGVRIFLGSLGVLMLLWSLYSFYKYYYISNFVNF